MLDNRVMSSPHLTLRQLRAFCLVAQEQSMTRAAEKLFLTPSALSMLIRSLEEELGIRLFERTTRRVMEEILVRWKLTVPTFL